MENKTHINKNRDNDSSMERKAARFFPLGRNGARDDKQHKYNHKHTVTYYLCFMYAEKALKFTHCK